MHNEDIYMRLFWEAPSVQSLPAIVYSPGGGNLQMMNHTTNGPRTIEIVAYIQSYWYLRDGNVQGPFFKLNFGFSRYFVK